MTDFRLLVFLHKVLFQLSSLPWKWMRMLKLSPGITESDLLKSTHSLLQSCTTLASAGETNLAFKMIIRRALQQVWKGCSLQSQWVELDVQFPPRWMQWVELDGLTITLLLNITPPIISREGELDGSAVSSTCKCASHVLKKWSQNILIAPWWLAVV